MKIGHLRILFKVIHTIDGTIHHKSDVESVNTFSCRRMVGSTKIQEGKDLTR
jgi:hypothetical protein